MHPMPRALAVIERNIVGCRACPRLVEWREQVARDKRAAYRDQTYWGKPVPGFGDPAARLLVCGLAPAAHGGNRTGRVFTGDRSGDWLYAALFRAGFANQPISRCRDDGLKLLGCWVTACVRCAPPDNKPTNEERDRCLPFLVDELRQLQSVTTIVALGGFAWQGVRTALAQLGYEPESPRPKFGHGAEAHQGPFTVIGCYHPSQQNTFTGRLTTKMLDQVFRLARRRSSR